MKSPALPARFPKGLPILGVASLIAGATEAYGQIVYTPVNGGSGTILGDTNNATLDFNGDTSGEAYLYFSVIEGGTITLVGITENSVAPVDTILGYDMLRVNAGTLIDASGFALKSAYIFGGDLGTWYDAANSVRGFIPVEFRLAGGGPSFYYGWIDLQLNRSGTSAVTDITLFGYAYESTTGAAINAGAIPEPGTSAAIVGGAAALLALRRRKKSEVAA